MNLLGYAGFASEDPMEDLKLFWKRGMAHLFLFAPLDLLINKNKIFNNIIVFLVNLAVPSVVPDLSWSSHLNIF
jgi:hypothetical protein